MSRLPPLDALPVFDAVARLGSVELAAQETGNGPGTVGQQIAALAAGVGCPLFRQDGERLLLTAEGQALHAVVAPALERIAAACSALRGRPQEGRLLLGVSPAFAARWLMPRLDQFHAQHPGVELEFVMTESQANLIGTVDLVISWDRIMPVATPGTVFHPLADMALGLVHAPGQGLHPKAGKLHVPVRIVPASQPDIWDVWGRTSGLMVTADRDLLLNSAEEMIAAAIKGQGVAVMEQRLITQELEDRSLAAPGGFTAIRQGLGVFMTDETAACPTVRSFIGWLARAL